MIRAILLEFIFGLVVLSLAITLIVVWLAGYFK